MYRPITIACSCACTFKPMNNTKMGKTENYELTKYAEIVGRVIAIEARVYYS